MRFGCCGNMVAKTPNGVGEHIIGDLVQARI